MDKTAVWVITEGGLKISENLEKDMGFDLFASRKLKNAKNACFFSSLKESIRENFNKYNGHIFIMSTGITVRLISDLIKSKTTDPAVLVIDDKGLNVISLLSGHIGGANRLCIKISEILGANPVITTATDVNNLPAIDVIAVENDISIENPENIKKINSLILNGKKIRIFDPLNLVTPHLKKVNLVSDSDNPDLVVDYIEKEYSSDPLLLRPRMLSAGIGCNRGTDMDEMKGLLFQVLENNNYSVLSLKALATVDVKMDEIGITELAQGMNLPVKYFDKNELNSVSNIKTPSEMAMKHIGAKSVCEAAAILASQGKLLIPKTKTKNVTIAIAKTSI
ncbi:MAG: cobalt-precorrin 5A hydrolase [Deltaproteobacteria bacterium]|nr:cobalt-precorrin 5A hydrolase [Deltaproteobacteria bacterium]